MRALWGRLRESLWLVPSVFVIGAILLGIGMVEASMRVDPEALAQWPRIFGAGPEGARSMLSAIAGSMITVAGVTFSITMVAVTQGSTQYSPRILRNFMRDRANQTALGTFVGIFAYCLVVLRTIREGEPEAFVPSLAVLVGVLLALVGVAVLIFFVHHIATILQASEIISRITRDTRKVVDRLYPDSVDHDLPDVARVDLHHTVSLNAWHVVPAPRTGYVQYFSLRRLVALAGKSDLLIRLERPTGEFVVAGQPLAWFARHPPGTASPGSSRETREVAGAVASTFTIGSNRALEHDPGFGIQQLVDVALKALSPAINDSTTARTCIDYLGALLVQLADRRMETEHRDTAGHLRVITVEADYESLLSLATDAIRRQAGGNVTVLERLLGMLTGVARATRTGARRRLVARHLEFVAQTMSATLAGDHDLARLDGLARQAIADATADMSSAAVALGPAGP